MKYSSVSPDSTQTDADKQDLLDFGKVKTEPCDSLLEFCKTKTQTCDDNLDELAELVSSQTDQFEFCKPSTVEFEKFGSYRDQLRDVINSPRKPKLATHPSVKGPRSLGNKFKKLADRDSPVSTLEEVYTYVKRCK